MIPYKIRLSFFVYLNKNLMFMNTVEDAKALGFVGFKTVAALKRDVSCIPQTKGVYLVLRKEICLPVFAEVGSGGFFKGKDPNVDISVLKNNWVAGTNILYIGMTGSSLRRRIKQYMQFGDGKPVGHQGGCYIWQMEDCDRLIICWKELTEEVPGEYETMLIRSFKDTHDGRRPFANRNK